MFGIVRLVKLRSEWTSLDQSMYCIAYFFKGRFLPGAHPHAPKIPATFAAIVVSSSLA